MIFVLHSTNTLSRRSMQPCTELCSQQSRACCSTPLSTATSSSGSSTELTNFLPHSTLTNSAHLPSSSPLLRNSAQTTSILFLTDLVSLASGLSLLTTFLPHSPSARPVPSTFNRLLRQPELFVNLAMAVGLATTLGALIGFAGERKGGMEFVKENVFERVVPYTRKLKDLEGEQVIEVSSFASDRASEKSVCLRLLYWSFSYGRTDIVMLTLFPRAVRFIPHPRPSYDPRTPQHVNAPLPLSPLFPRPSPFRLPPSIPLSLPSILNHLPFHHHSYYPPLLGCFTRHSYWSGGSSNGLGNESGCTEWSDWVGVGGVEEEEGESFVGCSGGYGGW